MPRSGDREQRDLQSAASAVVEEAATVVEDAAAVVESAAAVVQEAAAVVQETAAGGAWPAVERRRKPRLLRRLHDDGKVEWKHIAVYVPVLLLVIIVGALALWSFFEKQSVLGTEPAPLPKVTLITANAQSPLTAAWVRLLTDAEMQPTLVPLDRVETLQGVVVLCDVPLLPPALANEIAAFVRRGGSVAVAGQPPANAVGSVAMSADRGLSDNSMKFSEAVSPLLARLDPGHQVWVRPSPVAFLKETPQMSVDVRWTANARAAVMHMEKDGARYLWLGLDPSALANEDRQLLLLIKTAFRWLVGQPVSEGAIGTPQVASSFTTAAREAAHTHGFAFTVDRLRSPRQFSVRMSNRGRSVLQNPTVKVWLPPGVTRVALGGDLLMKRHVTLTGLPDEGACLIARPRLARGEERVMKLVIVAQRPK